MAPTDALTITLTTAEWRAVTGDVYRHAIQSRNGDVLGVVGAIQRQLAGRNGELIDVTGSLCGWSIFSKAATAVRARHEWLFAAIVAQHTERGRDNDSKKDDGTTQAS